MVAYNLCRAVGVLAGGKFSKARTVTIREQLIKIPARIAYSARRYHLHLPRNTRHQHRYLDMLDATQAPPVAA